MFCPYKSLYIILFLFPLFSEASSCQDYLNSSSTASTTTSAAQKFSDQFIHEEMIRHVRMLTGELDIDSSGAITGRYTKKQKKRVRNHLMRTLQGMGLDPKIKTYSVTKDRDKMIDPGVFLSELSKEEAKRFLSTSYPELYSFLEKEWYFFWGYKRFMERLRTNSFLKKVKFDLKGQPGLLASLEKLNRQIRQGDKWERYYFDFDEVHNVVVEIEGSTDPQSVLEVTAHYDTTGENKPGADDNGSGVTTLIELARLLSLNPPQKTVRLSFVDLEEFPFHLGSWFNAYELSQDKRNIIGSFVLDTIAYAPYDQKAPPAVIELGLPEMHEKKQAYAQSAKLAQAFLDPYEVSENKNWVSFQIEREGALPHTGDHDSYWRQGVPALFIAAPFYEEAINPHYHKKTDFHEYYNYEYFFSIALSVFEAVYTIAVAPNDSPDNN